MLTFYFISQSIATPSTNRYGVKFYLIGTYKKVLKQIPGNNAGSLIHLQQYLILKFHYSSDNNN